MRFTHFKIHDFRGIQHVDLALGSSPNSNVYTLVGLNESGKTTILEAINHFTYKTETLEPLELKGYSITDPHSLIPIAHRSNFNGEVLITVGLLCEDEDEKRIASALEKELGFQIAKSIGAFEISQHIVFKNSQHDKTGSNNLWTITFSGRKKHQKKDHPLEGEDWQKAVAAVKPLIPSILYFPNFLFDFPDKIYLEDTGSNDELHSFYRLVLQDVLDSLGNETNLETHLLARAKSGDRNDKKNLEGLLLQIGRHVTKTVFDAWNRMFQQRMGDKKVVVGCDCDDAGHCFLEMKIEDSDGYYLISERSLGFRWFFVFLLLTQYRGFRKSSPRNVLFLFDEPASNLHATAQAQLLQSFARLSAQCCIIYTTHSSHLINPDWLEGTFVVRNAGLDYEREVNDYSAQKTNITVTPYRQFVVKHPDQTSYYKPILDVLEYVPSRLDPLQDVVMLEGKNDFYVLRYVRTQIGSSDDSLSLLPGMGSGGLETPIKLYLAWGRGFVVLLDSDKEGRKQKKRYLEKFGASVHGKIITLEDIDPMWKNIAMEKLFTDNDRLGIQNRIFPNQSVFNKTYFHRAIQELILTGGRGPLCDESEANFVKLSLGLSARLRPQQVAGCD